MTSSTPTDYAGRNDSGSGKQSFRQRYPRHPAEVTADRLADALDKWPERFDAGDRDAVAQIRHILNDIAEEAEKW